MNKSKSKYFNTALCMDEALISLLKVKDLEYITIKEICEKAGVNRSTFYLHYENITDLLDEAIENADKRSMSYFSSTEGVMEKLDSADLSDLVLITQDYLLPYLRFILENKDLYRAAFHRPREMRTDVKYGNIKTYVIGPILKRFNIPDTHWRYYTTYYIHGIIAIVNEWLLEDCQDPIDMIAAIIEDCVLSTDRKKRISNETDKRPKVQDLKEKVE